MVFPSSCLFLLRLWRNFLAFSFTLVRTDFFRFWPWSSSESWCLNLGKKGEDGPEEEEEDGAELLCDSLDLEASPAVCQNRNLKPEYDFCMALAFKP